MRTAPQHVATSSYEQAKAKGCDTVQFKYDGRWVRIEVLDQYVRVFDAEGKQIVNLPDGFNNIPKSVSGTFIGNLLFGNELMVLWDMWVWGGERNGLPMKFVDLDQLPYKQRYSLLYSLHKRLVESGPYRIVANFPIDKSVELWNDEANHRVGLIFRNSNDPVPTTLYVARKYKEIPTSLT